MVLESRVDVALVEGPVSDPQIEVQMWRDDELVVIAAPDHSLTSEARVTAQMLADQSFLVREPGSGTRVVSELALARRGVKLVNTMRVGGTEAIKQGVAAGLGLAIVSRAAAADQLALGKIVVVEVEDLTIHRTLTRLRLSDRAVSPTAREFNELLDAER
jgi:DNA-binding transcriptional LysR family regulator